ncbi:F-box only protein 36 [Plakobranchus ocellatus]|uniref:F-box only protein 36 n=1 Tax=Plakobranchus ocellatus TaxID=259542 RepID=A0AAV3Y6F4_9GAST|nr:F-box only protein 36 [Plakobranchus ocellatus]
MANAWEKQCKPWLAEDLSIYQRTDTAPPPSKDFVQIFVTTDEVVFRMWKIIPPTRADANQVPTENRATYSEFEEDTKMRGDIARTLGQRELDYVDRLIHGHIDYPNRLPKKALLHMLYMLDLVTISRLSQVNKYFRELCSSDALWSKLYMQHTTQPITHELLMLTDKKGWREVFFMNKVQLQMHLRRETEKPTPKDKSTDFFLTS